MKTVSEIKDEVAQSFGYKNSEQLIAMQNPAWINELVDHVARRYAEQAVERCAEVAYSSESGLSVNQESILNVKTELK